MMRQKGLELLDKDEVARRLSLRNRKGTIDPGLVDDVLYRDPTFPKPVKYGRFNKWRADELDAYIAGLPIWAGQPRKVPTKKGGAQ